MSDENRVVSGNVNISLNSKERVAFDLMHLIAAKEAIQVIDAQKTKLYWLKLYSECLDAVSGRTVG
jgi:hypothetical protein